MIDALDQALGAEQREASVTLEDIGERVEEDLVREIDAIERDAVAAGPERGLGADLQGSLWGIHGIATDQEGNLYTAGVNSGRFNKFTPRAGANPEYMVGKPIYSAWQQ